MGKKHELIRQINYHAVAKGAIAIFLPLFALMIGIAVIIYFVHTGPERIALENKLKYTVGMQKNFIKSEFNIITSDLLFLSLHIKHENLYPGGGFLDPKQKAELNVEFQLFAETKKLYHQVRLLGENGIEIVRVNFNAGTPVVVPESELQNKKNRYYFADTFRLGPGEIFVSPFDLNIEHGQIEQPLKPMIRFGTPVFDKRGRKRGVVILNYFGAHLLRKFKDIDIDPSGESRSMLLNSDGYYLTSPNHEDEWGFMYRDRRDRVFGKTYSAAWKRIETAESGQFETGDGLFTFTTVYPLLTSQISNSGSAKAYSSRGATFDPKGYKWKIVSHWPVASLYAEKTFFFRWSLAILAFLAFILGTISWRLVRARIARRHSEAAMIESEEFGSSLLENSPIPILVVNEDTSIKYVNPILEELTGYTSLELIGKKVPYPWWTEEPRSGEIDEAKELLHKGGHRLERLFRKKNGDQFWVELTVTPIIRNGEFKYALSNWVDITQRKRAEEALRGSEEKYRSLFNDALDMIHIVDENGRIIDTNPIELETLGYTREEYLGKPLSEIIHPNCRMATKKAFESVLKGEEIRGYETTLLTKHGEKVDVEVNVVPQKKGEGMFIARAIIRNITKRKLEETEREALISELEDKNAELERFTYTVSHDLKSPLITIRGFLGILEKHALTGDTDRMKEDMSRISSATEKMQSLLEGLLELSRSGRQIDAAEEGSFAELAQEALDAVAGRLRERDIRVEIASGAVIHGDHARLHEVLENLVDNALKFSGDQPNPLIEIGSRQAGEETIFFVRDNGVGIDPKYHEKVFGLFDKLAHNTEGTGVGLAIVKKVVEAHGGLVWVESEGAGKGTTLCFTIPGKNCVK